MTSTSQYRRPGFQAPRTVTIPNSVTGNVYPTVVKDGVPSKGPDKNTPTISYLNAQTTKSRKSSSDSTPNHQDSTVSSQVPKESDESWWRKSHSSSQSITPSETPEPKVSVCKIIILLPHLDVIRGRRHLFTSHRHNW